MCIRDSMKCARIGNADTFEKIVFAFASEDSDIRLDELGIMNLSSTGAVSYTHLGMLPRKSLPAVFLTPVPFQYLF